MGLLLNLQRIYWVFLPISDRTHKFSTDIHDKADISAMLPTVQNVSVKLVIVNKLKSK